ncbi:MAG: hypothetical protein ACD_48C00040G0002 [uncultured bacterium]|uniref:FAD:protein FMN transferase n=1 Tax=Candidatus Magasanikbacteria bacterium GW2011_GWE2_42_7 TaxID=1619052 RepID=A0A0G1DKL3_9BACT|nr:MAG: hypothetical protein ACD_48C00040G0002 [uncultured bacterium]KKS52168.1 MAG: hypothetical protein UV18_C0011G0046 [Candidatus Magasanikbacteria bacterium GW2011_GWC2_42_27]KKS71411.1 MAG: hypothetical protein UV42_C0029G0004 [Candidatus Magasanikbacteria bacterium GW2011_GWE2_42_7]KKT04582.1 MAG: hypothetical protein UV82_C0007G0082 [Candidatus Magasanikbacteria bacterium GW2011_GWD2_43_18]KKT25041.1 MAG: hypothetical protein UW10_C0015G0005 [Candidatus Magasanikbacteria bacterium GW201
MYHTFSFSAFNTTVAGTIDCGEHVDTQKATQLEQDIEAHAYAFEKICSRFDPASELSQLHASGAGTHTVSPILFALLQSLVFHYQQDCSTVYWGRYGVGEFING